MPAAAEVIAALERAYPPELAESWDAVGLVCGDPAEPVTKVLFCVDPVAETVEEAVEKQHRWTRFLAEAGQQLSATLDVKATLQSLVRLAVPQLADWATVHFKEGEQVCTPLIHHWGGKEQMLRDLLQRYPPRAGCIAASAGKVTPL